MGENNGASKKSGTMILASAESQIEINGGIPETVALRSSVIGNRHRQQQAQGML